jgi:hypothetical protein
MFDIDIHRIHARGAEPEHLHYDVRFLLDADRAAPLALSEESRSLAWTPLDRIAQLNPEESSPGWLRKRDVASRKLRFLRYSVTAELLESIDRRD